MATLFRLVTLMTYTPSWGITIASKPGCCKVDATRCGFIVEAREV